MRKEFWGDRPLKEDLIVAVINVKIELRDKLIH